MATGLYDDADLDDVVLLVTSAGGIAPPALPASLVVQRLITQGQFAVAGVLTAPSRAPPEPRGIV